MNMRTLLTASLLGGCALLTACAPGPTRKELPYGDCLRTSEINRWGVVDGSTFVAANGPNYFRIKTTVDCPRADLGGGIRFRLSNSDRAVTGPDMRMCGGLNEQIVRRDDPPCQILSIEKIDKSAFDKLLDASSSKGSGAGPTGSVP
ncbi:hypothetical protein SAMN02800694_0146 [Luteibacter sp. UNCMF331Sha3.1]|uniref:DUF6491 family protein n=1 Tax=Luteibacter sp. UNCMF331Sha3.1 TaxID=1502760 RepID=UPI0008CD3C5F|nr:DUF6491 family protein [Luteibacter sp. UNCMF331Sha3.1]SEM19844.1 hypothetical protein SAMN02800694_0146 [Luteibacter sp. UNCMF331Sha3.1]